MLARAAELCACVRTSRVPSRVTHRLHCPCAFFRLRQATNSRSLISSPASDRRFGGGTCDRTWLSRRAATSSARTVLRTCGVHLFQPFIGLEFRCGGAPRQRPASGRFNAQVTAASGRISTAESKIAWQSSHPARPGPCFCSGDARHRSAPCLSRCQDLAAAGQQPNL
jgi:hypothetical protein